MRGGMAGVRQRAYLLVVTSVSGVPERWTGLGPPANDVGGNSEALGV